MYGEEISSIIDGSLIPLNEEWTLDLYGNIITPAEEDELPLDYQTIGEFYIELDNFDTDQNDLIQFTVYEFQIYRYGFEDHNGYLTNKMAYTNINDCLDAAMLFVDTNWEFLYNFYSTGLNDDLVSAGYSISSYQVVPPKPDFYPPEPPSGYYRKIEWDKLLILHHLPHKPRPEDKVIWTTDDDYIIRPFDRR